MVDIQQTSYQTVNNNNTFVCRISVIARSTVAVEKKNAWPSKSQMCFPKTIKKMKETDRFITKRQLEQTPATKS